MTAPQILTVAVRNQRSEIERLGQLSEEFGSTHGLSADDVFAINLVLDEVVLNVIEYAYEDDLEHSIAITLRLDGDLLTIRVEDDGRAFNPLDIPPPDLDLPIDERPIGGLGVHLVKSTMDSVDYRREADRNVLTMTKKVSVDRAHM